MSTIFFLFFYSTTTSRRQEGEIKKRKKRAVSPSPVSSCVCAFETNWVSSDYLPSSFFFFFSTHGTKFYGTC